jgi:hypothetical protein
MLADLPGMQRRTATKQHDPTDLGEVTRGRPHAGQDRGALALIEPTAEGVAQGLRLLVDLLEHEMLEPTLLDGVGGEAELPDRPVDAGRVEVDDVDMVGRDAGDVPVVEVDDPARMGDDRGRVGGDEALPFPDADDEGAALAGGDDDAGFVAGQHGDAVGPFHLTQGRDDRGTEVALEGFADQPGQRLRVGLGDEDMALGFEASAEGPVVLDDAIMHERDATALGEVGVGVGLGRRAMGRPAGVGDADAGRLLLRRRPG